MAIQILPPRLANQIAAGEVVERPASVVKELVENSIDAGANKIHIDVERGGHKLIRIRDNGKGIDQNELTLALSRHATSKLHTLDDLESISSLGFRGEALASISSVSRLTLSSKPTSQETAWQACAEGRDMDVTIQPTSHPDGTTIEVKDLFFNTPARRKFLRTEKTEFTHIDELVKRIALSRFDVAITLTHNTKVVRQYRVVSDQQNIKRVSQVAGKDFQQHASFIESGNDGLLLNGWVLPAGHTNTTQYTYVNGRMMRDKLILHAIRQAFEEHNAQLSIPGFVVYLEIDPKQVDVNVHPAKHEVRFHQARLVHDFIVHGIKQVLKPTDHSLDQKEQQEHSAPSFDNTPSFKTSLELNHSESSAPEFDSSKLTTGKSNLGFSNNNDRNAVSSTGRQYSANQLYQGLKYEQMSEFDTVDEPLIQTNVKSEHSSSSFFILEEGIILLKSEQFVQGSHLKYALPVLWQQQLEQDATLGGKALLLPVRVNLDKPALALLAENNSWMTLIGFDLHLFQHYVMIKKTPVSLYSEDMGMFMEELLSVCKLKLDGLEQWLEWLQEKTPNSYYNSQHFTKIMKLIEKNPLCLARVQEKAISIDVKQIANIVNKGLLHG